jgi:hypothetical protein
MNLIALISAVIGVSLLMHVVLYGNKLANRWLRYLAIIVGIFIALAITGSVPALFGDSDLSTSSKAGEYLFFLGILFVGIKSIFFKNKNPVSSSHKNCHPDKACKITQKKVQQDVASSSLTPNKPEEVPQQKLPHPPLQKAMLCPSCRKEMVKRRASNGPHVGNLFWVCSEFQTCKTVLPTD